MKILGIDPGLTHTGWGVIEAEAGRLAFVAAGRISTQASAPMAARLADIYTELSRILDLYAPAAAAVEATFVNANPASALKLGQARGVALLAPATRGLPVFEYAANVVKKSVVGAGHADKAQIGAMVRILLPRAGDLAVDAADALAIAITHAHHAPAERMEQHVRQTDR